MSTETPRPGLARTIRDSVRHGPFGPLTPNEAREVADTAREWLLARLTDDDVVEAGARGMVQRLLGEVDPRRSMHPCDLSAARAALSAAAALIGGGSDE